MSRIRIDNVWHEFSTIPHVRGDVPEVVLNRRGSTCARVVPFEGDLRAHLFFKADGDGEQAWSRPATSRGGRDRGGQSDHPISTVSGTGAVIDMDLWVTSGRAT